jgi:hypothetical protein
VKVNVRAPENRGHGGYKTDVTTRGAIDAVVRSANGTLVLVSGSFSCRSSAVPGSAAAPCTTRPAMTTAQCRNR